MAAPDPYQTLGVSRTATEFEIRSAYRKLAKKHHPDVNKGNEASAERFKAIASAYDILSDADKKARFDRGEIDGNGQERVDPRMRPGPRSRGAPGGGPQTDFGMGDDPADLFARFFRDAGVGRGGAMRGEDRRYSLEVSFLEAVNGATRRLSLPDGKGIDVTIPAGLESGQVLRLRGQGGPGTEGGPAGDALIEVTVAPHPFFRREGDDIHLDLPLTVKEAVLGARIMTPTPTGAVALTVPEASDTGARMRLRGRGVPARAGRPAGDLYVTIRVVIGAVDETLKSFLRNWTPPREVDPRGAMAEQV